MSLARLPDGPAALLLEHGRVYLPDTPGLDRGPRRGSLAIGAGGAAYWGAGTGGVSTTGGAGGASR